MREELGYFLKATPYAIDGVSTNRDKLLALITALATAAIAVVPFIGLAAIVFHRSGLVVGILSLCFLVGWVASAYRLEVKRRLIQGGASYRQGR